MADDNKSWNLKISGLFFSNPNNCVDPLEVHWVTKNEKKRQYKRTKLS